MQEKLEKKMLFILQEAAEAANKFVKKFQLEHSRQTNAVDRNLDTFLRLQHQSDPHVHRYIDNRARQRQQSDSAYAKKPLPQSVLDLCKDGFVPDEGYDTQDSEDPQGPEDPLDPQDSSDTDSE